MHRLKQLIAALRSGKYQQAQSKLASPSGAFCCLGVACELFRLETGIGQWQPDRGLDFGAAGDPTLMEFYINERGEHYRLAQPVEEWLLGLSGNPETTRRDINISLPNPPGLWCTASDLNDWGFTFDQIADILDWNDHALVVWLAREETTNAT